MTQSIAAAQTVAARGDVQANLEQHAHLARAAAAQGARLIVFPELSLTGYELDLADELAFEPHDSRLTPLLETASSLNAILVVGAPIRLGAELHIGAFILAPDNHAQVYTKQRLGTAFPPEASPNRIVPPAETTIFQPGTCNPLIHDREHTAAIGICAESLRNGHADAAANRGASVYLTSHFGIPLDADLRARVLRKHAIRNRIAVAFANHGGPTGGLEAGGRSAIWSPVGTLLGQLNASGAGVVIATRNHDEWRGETLPRAS